MTFDEVRKAVFAAHARGDYQAGLDVIRSYEPRNSEESEDIGYWTMCLLSRLGRFEEAVAELAKNLDAGYWWGRTIFQDPDLEPMQANPNWQRLLRVSLERADQSRPVPRTPVELSPETGEVRATLVILHGASERPQMMIDRCARALQHGCRLLALHGTEPFASSRFGWPVEGAEETVISQITASGWPASPILVGYSQGSGLAGYLGWTRQVGCVGLVLVSPSMRIRGVPVPSPRLAKVPTVLVVGDDDWAIEDTRQVAVNLERSDVPVRLDERPGIGHEWPADADQTLIEAVDWILSLAS